MTGDKQVTGADAGREAAGIFLSYSRREREKAARLADALRDRGFTVFRDTDDILPTEEWRRRLESLIAEADTVVFLLSPNSAVSEVCTWEVEYATSLRKRIAPIVIEEVDANTIPPLLARLNFIFCTERDRFDDAVDTLVSALNTDIDWVREHTRLAGLAGRWEQAGKPRRQLLRRHEISGAEGWRDRRPAGAPEITGAQAAFISESRRAASARQRNMILGAVAAAVFALALSALSYSLYVRSNNELNKALLEQSRFLNDSATEYLDAKNYLDAMALSLEGLPHDEALLERPLFPPLAETLGSSLLLDRELSVISNGDIGFTNVELSPDGSLLFTTSLDGTASLWSLADKQEKLRFEGHTAAILSAAVDFAAGVAITGSDDGTARLWRLSDGRPIGSPIGHGGAVWRVALSPDGAVAASAAREDEAVLTSTADGSRLATLSGHAGAVSDLAFNADGTKIVTGSADHTARVWRVPGGELLRVLEGHSEPITSVAFSPTDDIVLTGSHDGTARLWDIGASVPALFTLRGHTDSVLKVAFSPSGRLGFTGSKDNTARLWSFATGEEIALLAGHEGQVDEVAFSTGTPYLATASTDGTARIWGATNGPAVAVLNGHDDVIWDLAFGSDSQSIATASSDGTVRIWKAGPSAADHLFDPAPGVAYRMAMSPDGSRLALAMFDGSVKLLDLETLSEVNAWQAHAQPTIATAFSPDGSRLLTGAVGGEVRLWDAESGALQRSFAGHTDDVTRMVFSPDGALAATAAMDKTVRLWDVGTGEQQQLLSDSEISTALAFTDDGQSILVGGSAGRVRKLNTSDGSQIAEYGPFTPLVGAVLNMHLSPDGRSLLVSVFGSEPKIVSLKDGEEIALLRGHTNYVETMSYSPDGQRAVIVPTDAAPVLWQLGDNPIALARYRGVAAPKDALFSADGQTVLFIDERGRVSRWRAPRSLADEISRAAGMVASADPLSLKQKCENFLAPPDQCEYAHLLKGQ